MKKQFLYGALFSLLATQTIKANSAIESALKVTAIATAGIAAAYAYDWAFKNDKIYTGPTEEQSQNLDALQLTKNAYTKKLSLTKETIRSSSNATASSAAPSLYPSLQQSGSSLTKETDCISVNEIDEAKKALIALYKEESALNIEITKNVRPKDYLDRISHALVPGLGVTFFTLGIFAFKPSLLTSLCTLTGASLTSLIFEKRMNPTKSLMVRCRAFTQGFVAGGVIGTALLYGLSK